MNLPNHVYKTLNKDVKPFEAYMRKKLITDGYTPEPSLAALTIQFHNIYEKDFEKVLAKNPDAGFFKDVWNGVKKGVGAVTGAVTGVIGGVGNLLTGVGQGVGGLGQGIGANVANRQNQNNAQTQLNQQAQMMAMLQNQNSGGNDKMTTYLLIGGAALVAFLIFKK